MRTPRLWLVVACGLIMVATAQGQLKELFGVPPSQQSQPQPPSSNQKANTIADGIGGMLKSLSGIPLEEELEIGGSVAVEIVARFGGVWRETNATERVNLIGKSIARYSNRPQLNFRFGILDSTEVNAFSAPGGYVFITRGLYELAADDDQLGGILAHEIAHVSERHALKLITKRQFLAAGVRVGAASSSELRQFSDGIEAFAKSFVETGFAPGDEYDADFEGRRIARLCGYAEHGLCSVLEMLRDRADPGRKVFSTHPPLQSRISRLHQTDGPAGKKQETTKPRR